LPVLCFLLRRWALCQVHFLRGGELATAEAKAKANCKLDGVTVKHNDSKKFYSAKTVASDKDCKDVSVVRKCSDGKLSGNDKYKFASCKEDTSASGIQAPGYVYLNDTFNPDGTTSAERFSDYWSTGPCSTESHAASSKPGAIDRSGSCKLKKDGDNSYVRFVVYPFNSRNTDEDSGDWGKGGGEALPWDVIENAYGFSPEENKAENKKGWDLGGKEYLVNGNTVRHSWDFRIVDISLLEPVASPGTGVKGVWAKKTTRCRCDHRTVS
jgi:hypothetical protein